MRGFVALAVFAFSVSWASAFVLIDDFTQGNYTHTINWPDTTDVNFVDGLDTNHDAWGNRQTLLVVANNPHHVPVTISVGSGSMAVSAPPGMADGLSTELRTDWGLGPNIKNLDLSHEINIFVDLDVHHPDNRVANQWSFFVRDANGNTGTNDGFTTRSGGIKFSIPGFTGHVDWSQIQTMKFTQKFDSPAHPDVYNVSEIYATSSDYLSVYPTAVTPVYGKFSGNTDLGLLTAPDGQFMSVCRFLVPNLSEAPVTVQFECTFPFVPRFLSFSSTAKVNSLGQFSETLDMWDWTANAYGSVDARTYPLPSFDSNFAITASGDVTRYSGPNRAGRARIRVRPTGLISILAWCVDFDQVVWVASPR